MEARHIPKVLVSDQSRSTLD